MVSMNDFGKTELTDDLLQRCFDFIDAGLATGKGVLVHFTLGVNRSATICTACVIGGAPACGPLDNTPAVAPLDWTARKPPPS
jgi:hypothetical protein